MAAPGSARLADILEDLAPAEREAIFNTLDEDVAAEALEEVEPKLQRQLVESMDSERAADIMEEMDPSAAADLLGELRKERSAEILRRNAGLRCTAHPDTKPPRMRLAQDRRVVLELVVVLRGPHQPCGALTGRERLLHVDGRTTA